MLLEFTISNLAIIETLRLRLDPGFVVLTGETGAGKSIIIDAMTLLLGGRGSTDLIRTGCETAYVEGIFELSEPARATLEPLLQDMGLAGDAAQLILLREISHSRRSTCRVNGRALTLGALQKVGQHLVDIHGQGDHLSLLQVRSHVDIVDHFGGLNALREAFATGVRRLGEIRHELTNLRRDERELARRVDLLTYQANEIRAARLRPGEDVELRRQLSLLANAEKRAELASEIYNLLYEGNDEGRSIMDLLGALVDSLADLVKLDDSLSSETPVAAGALYQLEDWARVVRDYRDSIEYDPGILEQLDERLDLIQNLRRKYGDTIEEIQAFAERAEMELDGITHAEARIEELSSEEQTLLLELAVRGQSLTNARKAAAERLQQAVDAELCILNMEQARFVVDIRWTEARDGVLVDGLRYGFGPSGLDRVEFFISPNLGEEPKPLIKIVSGGETSRLMLALKAALSAIDPVPTLIFDEIDAGIGGRTGSIVGHKLWSLAQGHQVLCVTHLAQIAAYSVQHIGVTKEMSGGRTVSAAHALSHDERIEELAVMLGGAATEATRRSAEELLRQKAPGPQEA